MNVEAITHENTRQYVYPLSRHELCFRLKAAKCDLTGCTLVYWDRDEGFNKRKTCPMHCLFRDSQTDYFEADVCFPAVASYIKYFFKLKTPDVLCWYTSLGVSKTEPEDGFFEFLYANENDVHALPEWAGKQIYYQIFPERFCNDDPENDPKQTEIWGSRPTRTNFMGGDLKGIIHKIGYLADLGVTCLYLTPVFKSPSNHKYDTEDYFQIDPHFGTLEDLKELVWLCHERKMRVILDGVFNHCGFTFPAFQDVCKNGEDSPYKNWFLPESFPVQTDPPNYECVGHYKYMPKLNYSCPEIREYFLRVGLYWLREAYIDGWRLDVADEVDYTFWQLFRQKVKWEFPNAILIAETWGSAARMLQGDQMDSAMNYLFRDALVAFFAEQKICSSEFDSRVNRMLALYSKPCRHAMYNLIDSHDTPRFLSECGGVRKRLQLAVGFQMTFVGAPAVYYGDEVGMSGENDPDCRGAMQWNPERQDRELFSWYRRLIRLRREHPCLTEGGFVSTLCDDKKSLYGFTRTAEYERAYVLFHNSDEDVFAEIPVLDPPGTIFQAFPDGGMFAAKEKADGGYNRDRVEYKGNVKVPMPAYSMKILFIKQEESICKTAHSEKHSL